MRDITEFDTSTDDELSQNTGDVKVAKKAEVTQKKRKKTFKKKPKAS